MNKIEISDTKLHKNKIINKILRIDYEFLIKIYGINPKLTFFIRIYSFFGSILFWGPLILILYLIGRFMEFNNVKDFGLILLSCLILSSTIIGSLKKIAKRKRPYFNEQLKSIYKIEITNRDRWFGFKKFNSFPSGHIGQISSSMIIFSYYMGQNWMLPLFIATLLMILARNHLGVHFLSDTLVGGLFGIGIGYLTIFLWPVLFDPFFHWIWVTFLI